MCEKNKVFKVIGISETLIGEDRPIVRKNTNNEQ
jgi:hypothetical protein